MGMPQYILVDDEEIKVDSYHDNYFTAKSEQEKAAEQDEVKLSIYKLVI